MDKTNGRDAVPDFDQWPSPFGPGAPAGPFGELIVGSDVYPSVADEVIRRADILATRTITDVPSDLPHPDVWRRAQAALERRAERLVRRGHTVAEALVESDADFRETDAFVAQQHRSLQAPFGPVAP